MKYTECYYGQTVKSRFIKTDFGIEEVFNKETLLRIVHLNPETHTVDVRLVDDDGYYNSVLPSTLQKAKLHSGA